MNIPNDAILLWTSPSSGFRGIYDVNKLQQGADRIFKKRDDYEEELLQKIKTEYLDDDFEGIQKLDNAQELINWCQKHKFETPFFYDGMIVAEKIYRLDNYTYSAYYSFNVSFSENYFEIV